jgi:hypothetical protein
MRGGDHHTKRLADGWEDVPPNVPANRWAAEWRSLRRLRSTASAGNDSPAEAPMPGARAPGGSDETTGETGRFSTRSGLDLWNWPRGQQFRPPESTDSRSASDAPRQRTQRRTVFLRGQSCRSKGMDGYAVAQLLGILRPLRDEINDRTLPTQAPTRRRDLLAELEAGLRRFPQFAGRLRKRSRNRAGIGITDEYDVQDLIHAALTIYTDDVRREETTPSFAGAGARMDFLLKRERIAIDVKCTRPSLDQRGLGDELSADIARYAAHPDADAVVFFVYDLATVVANHRGFEDDFSARTTESLAVRCVVVNGASLASATPPTNHPREPYIDAADSLPFRGLTRFWGRLPNPGWLADRPAPGSLGTPGAGHWTGCLKPPRGLRTRI